MADFSKTGKSNVRRGKTHERRIAKLLQEYTGVEFRRRRVEGRDSTVIERESTSDVIPVRGICKFSLEAKCGAGFSIDALCANPSTNMFTQWWHQVAYDAKLVTQVFENKSNYIFYPMLFFKPHKNWDWVAVPTEVIDKNIIITKSHLQCLKYDGYKTANPISMNVIRTKNKNNYKMVELDLPAVTFCRWKDFIEAIDPTSMFYELG